MLQTCTYKPCVGSDLSFDATCEPATVRRSRYFRSIVGMLFEVIGSILGCTYVLALERLASLDNWTATFAGEEVREVCGNHDGSTA